MRSKTNRLARVSMIAGISATSLAPFMLLKPPPVTSFNISSLLSHALGSLLVYLVFAVVGISGLCGVIFGHIARQQIRADFEHQRGFGMAMSGIILGYLWGTLVIIKIGFNLGASL